MDPSTRPQDRWDIVALATWQATRRYRGDLLKGLAGADLHLFGDAGWPRLLPQASYRGPVRYGVDLAQVYGASTINLNATSLQMPTAINQRCFDVPAAHGFLLTDDQADVHLHFAVGQEAIVYRNADELKDLIAYYRSHDAERLRIVAQAHHRVLAEHTYPHRLQSLVTTLRDRHR